MMSINKIKDIENFNESNIYLSTMVFNDDISKAIEFSEKFDFRLEFSSGVKYEKGLVGKLFESNLKGKLIHNYFPAPKKPFVLDLSSENKSIRNKSLDHCKKNIEYSRKLNSNYFSFHSGFCFEPNHTNLGGKLGLSKSNSREKSLEIFLESITDLINHARLYDVNLCIENNVLTRENFFEDYIPLLCCTADEMIHVLEQINDKYLSILFDSGHMKVTANTLEIDLCEEFIKIKDYVSIIHHSENNALKDTNSPLKDDYWLLKFLNIFKKTKNVIEVKNLSLQDIYKQIKILKSE